MAAQAGKDLLLKLDDGLGAFITVAGLRTRQLTFNADSVDITSQESSGRWRELLAGAGIRRAGVSGSGVFRDETSDAQMRQVFFDGVIRIQTATGGHAWVIGFAFQDEHFCVFA